MSLPYFRMYPTDYEADTAHLTLLEDGVYSRLLRLCWLTPGCSLPDDEAWILRRLRARTNDEIEATRTVLGEFFRRNRGRLHCPRLSREYADAKARHDRARRNGEKGGRPAKALKDKEASESHSLTNQNQNHTVEASASTSRPRKRGTRLPESWVLPREWGEWALSEGWPESVIRDQADRFKDHWIAAPGQRGVKVDWFATWRNWMRKSSAPKVVNGDGYERPSKSSERFNAFVAGARGTS